MRHLNSGSKLGRNPAHRRATLRNLVTNVIEKERITTTVTRAKAARPLVERMITLGKRDSLHTRRQAAAYLMTPGATKKLFDDIAPRFADRPGGYTRIIHAGFRIGDGAQLAILELFGSKLKKKEKKEKKKVEAETEEPPKSRPLRPNQQASFPYGKARFHIRGPFSLPLSAAFLGKTFLQPAIPCLKSLSPRNARAHFLDAWRTLVPCRQPRHPLRDCRRARVEQRVPDRRFPAGHEHLVNLVR